MLEVDAYDSPSTYAHDIRAEVLTRVKAKLHESWGSWKKIVLRTRAQQESGSNDCGLYVVNNALRVLGSDEVHTSMKAFWTLVLGATFDFAAQPSKFCFPSLITIKSKGKGPILSGYNMPVTFNIAAG